MCSCRRFFPIVSYDLHRNTLKTDYLPLGDTTTPFFFFVRSIFLLDQYRFGDQDKGYREHRRLSHMNPLLSMFREPPRPINESKPVLLVWRVKGERRETKANNLNAGRAMALKVIGRDDRIVVHLFDKVTKENRGRVGLYAGYPYWFFKNEYKSIRANGTVDDDPYDF